MKKLYFKKIIWGTVVAITLGAVYMLCYWPFVQMKDFVTGRREIHYISNGLPPDKIEELHDYLEVYPLCWFIHKGDTYFNIPFIDNSLHIHKMDIKFNCDNRVTINEGTNKFDLHVNRTWIEPMLYPFSDSNYALKLHETCDSLFVGVFMYDDNNNEIDIYRQKRTMPLGRRRVGFRISINGKVYVTGDRERFDY